MNVTSALLATIAVGTTAVAIERTLTNRTNSIRAEYWQSKYKEESQKCTKQLSHQRWA